jgi:hypothetical protein
MKEAEPTSSPAQQQIRPPPVSQHLREFATSWHAWAVLGRNLIPVVGIYAFKWSAALAVFNYWFDGLVAVAAITAAVVPRVVRESHTQGGVARGLVMDIVRGALTWVILIVVVGLPYWIVLIPLHKLLLGIELRRALAGSPLLWLTFGSLAAGHFWKAFHIGYDTMPDNELKQRVRWDTYLLILRAVAMFFMGSYGLALIMVPLMALVLTYFEIWPDRVLGAVFGDPKRLWEYDPEKSKD